MNQRLLAFLAALPSLLVAHTESVASVVTFQNASAGALASYSEAGFTVDAVLGPWLVNTGFGNPAPFIQFTNPAGAGPLTASVSVSHAGAAFTFSSVDLYSSITTIPYAITGFLNSVPVFAVSGTVPNTLGGFATVFNPQAGFQVDSLTISLTNPALACCSNPMGLDNILLSPAAPVPEPSGWMLLLGGLALTLRSTMPGARRALERRVGGMAAGPG